MVQQYLQMLVGHVSVWDREVLKKKNETQSFTRSTVTSQALMETKHDGFRRFARISDRYGYCR
jgi:hypothetical protein